MVGIPDGLGAFDNLDGTFTLVMNHELGSTLGANRAHGAKGAFVSKWVIPASSTSSRTDQLDQVSDGVGAQIGQTRLWRLTFDDITNPELGGKVDLLIDGRV